MLLHAIVFALMTLWPAQASDGSREPSGLVSSRIEDRVTKVFDFDEERFGNYENMPMNWQQLTAPAHPGHPRFLEPMFDKTVGHLAPPSFKLPLAGGSLACHYLAKDISVHPSCDYLVTAWIRPQGLNHARAYITAYFLDHALQELTTSRHRSDEIRGGNDDEPWQRVTVQLVGGFERARWIGISVHVEQSEMPDVGPTAPRPIRRQDIRAAAWFDDITVVRLPRVRLNMSAPGNVFEHDRQVSCVARVVDLDGRGLKTHLEVLDADGEILEQRPVRVVPPEKSSQAVTLAIKSPGFYTARLTVDVEGHERITHEEDFVRIAAPISTARRGSNAFGVTVGPSAPVNQKISDQLLDLLGATAVKVPLWRRDMDDAEIVEGDRRADVLIRALRARGVTVVGVLSEPPPSLLQAFGHPQHTALDVLSSSPDRWRPYLAFLLARYGHEVQAWQVGPDDNDEDASDEQIAAAVTNVRDVLQPLVGTPRIVAPKRVVTQLPETPSAADVLLVTVGSQFGSDRLVRQVEHLVATEAARTWISLEPLAKDRFDRSARLTETARRIVAALQTGAEKVFVTQPWTVRPGEPRVQPDETFCVVRTLFQSLAGLKPTGEVWLDHGIRAFLFADRTRGEGALVVWTEAEGAGPREIVTDAVPDAKQYDIWGRTRSVEDAPEGRRFMVDAPPSVLLPVDPARVRTFADFHLDVPNVQVQVEPHRCKLMLRNSYTRNLVGRLELIPPHGWQVTPQQVNLHAQPGKWTEIDLTLRPPSNQAIGEYTLHARLHGEGQGAGPHVFTAPLFVECPGLDVNVLTRMEDGRLHVVQRITNRTGRTLDLRSLILYPDMRQDARIIRGLADGQTTHREYQLDRVQELPGRPIRVSLEEISGSLRCHQLVTLQAVPTSGASGAVELSRAAGSVLPQSGPHSQRTISR